MSAELVPYSDFENSYELARQLINVVIEDESLLEERRIFGPIARYGQGIEKAIGNVRKGQREHLSGELGHFAIRDNDIGDVVGTASIYPDLELRRLRAPVPPILAMGRLAVELPYATPNIQAWMLEGIDGLGDVYKELLKLSSTNNYHRRIQGTPMQKPWHIGSAWTVESRHSPREVHEAIASAGLSKVARKRFDEGESRFRIPPRATLYADIKGSWATGKGKLKELRTGEQSSKDEAIYEATSQNPGGFR